MYRGPTLAELQKRKDPAALKARVQQLAADPGTRRLVETGLLQKFGLDKFAKQRLLNQRLNAKAVPGSTLTNRDVAHQANAATDLTYGAPIALAQRQAQQAPDWYANYANILQQSAANTQAQAGQSAQAIQGLYRSGPNAPNSPQSTIGSAQAGTASLLGEAEKNFLNRSAAAAVGQGHQEQNKALQRESDLRKEAGAANLKTRGDITRQEATTVATNAVAGINQQKADTASSKANADFLAKYGHTPAYAAAHPSEFSAAALKRQQQLHPKAGTQDAPFKYGYTKKEWLALPLSERQRITKANTKSPQGPGSGKDQYGNTPVQQQGRTSSFRAVLRNARQLHTHQPGLGVQQILGAIGPDYSSVNQDVLIGAVQMATLGHVGPATAKALRQLGVDASYWGAQAPRRVVKRPKPGDGAPANP